MDGYECRACGSTAALFKEIRAVRFARSARWVEGRIEKYRKMDALREGER